MVICIKKDWVVYQMSLHIITFIWVAYSVEKEGKIRCWLYVRVLERKVELYIRRAYMLLISPVISRLVRGSEDGLWR